MQDVDETKNRLLELIDVAAGKEQINFYFSRPRSEFSKYKDDPEVVEAMQLKFEELEITNSQKNELRDEIEEGSEYDNPFKLMEKARGGQSLDIKKEEGYWEQKQTVEIPRMYLRYWSPSFDEFELKFANFLFEKLDGYGKDWDFIPVEQMINGTLKKIRDSSTGKIIKKVRIDYGTGIAVKKSYKAREAIHYKLIDRFEKLKLIKVRRGLKANPKDKYPTNAFKWNLKRDLITWDDINPLTPKK